MLLPGNPELQGVFETQLTRSRVGMERCLSHQQSNEIVGQPVDPHLLASQGRRLTAQLLHAQGALDIAPIQFDLPSASKQGLQGRVVCGLGTPQGRDQDFPTGAHLSSHQRARRLIVVRLTHPVWFVNWLLKHDQVIAWAYSLPAPKVGPTRAGPVLLKDRINAPFAQGAQQKRGGVKGIADQQVPPLLMDGVSTGGESVHHRPFLDSGQSPR